MRILRKVGIVLVVVAAVLATAFSAFGAKPEQPVKPTTTTVPDEPMGGYTCAEYYGAEYAAMLASHQFELTSNGFQFTLSGKKDFVCFDVDSANPGVWSVAATSNNGTTQVGRLLLVPRDSYHPGDECARVDLRNVGLPIDQDLGRLPASTVNACGTEFAEWIGGTLVKEATGEPHPLAFYAQMVDRSSGASVVLKVMLP
jgi:hypothetical protein